MLCIIASNKRKVGVDFEDEGEMMRAQHTELMKDVYIGRVATLAKNLQDAKDNGNEVLEEIWQTQLDEAISQLQNHQGTHRVKSAKQQGV
jgi:hypothetical protein